MAVILLDTAYFPPVHYVARVKQGDRLVVEQHDHYCKQSYRNRCYILAANGTLALVVPVVKGSAPKMLTRDARVDYSTRWQKIHFKSIESAYRNSPFYDYYIDDFRPFFERREKFLVELNLKILECLLSCLSLPCPVSLTGAYLPAGDRVDLRGTIHPKVAREDHAFTPYHQTFAGRFPFIPGLSALDLLFNTGPGALACLQGENR